MKEKNEDLSLEDLQLSSSVNWWKNALFPFPFPLDYIWLKHLMRESLSLFTLEEPTTAILASGVVGTTVLATKGEENKIFLQSPPL